MIELPIGTVIVVEESSSDECDACMHCGVFSCYNLMCSGAERTDGKDVVFRIVKPAGDGKDGSD
jgi:hypothetical protein